MAQRKLPPLTRQQEVDGIDRLLDDVSLVKNSKLVMLDISVTSVSGVPHRVTLNADELKALLLKRRSETKLHPWLIG